MALIIWSNFLCNLFPSQPPNWSSSIRLLKVEPLIPASPLAPITSCHYSSQISALLCFKVSVLCSYCGRFFFFSLLHPVNSAATGSPSVTPNVQASLYHYLLSSSFLHPQLPLIPPRLSLLLSCHGSSVFCCCLVWSDFAQTRLALGKVRSPESLLRSPQVAGTMNTL